MNSLESSPRQNASSIPAAGISAASKVRLKKKSNRRRRTEIVQFRVDPDELALINANAGACQLTTAEFLRRLGQGYIPPSKVDLVAVRELCQVAGDLGRLGGLLRLWITEKKGGGQGASNSTISVREIDVLWADIQSTYKILKAKIEASL